MTPPLITDDQRRARLAQRHHLAAGARSDDIALLADDLGALHSSDPATVYLAALARMANPSIAAITAALYDHRSVLRHHAMRRTVWVFTPPVARAAHAACTRSLATKEWATFVKAVDAAGIATDAGAWVAAARAQILAVIHRVGSISARQLAKEVPELTVKVPLGSGKYVVEVAAHTRIVQNLGFDGSIVRGRPRGSWTTSEYAWSVMADWIGRSLDDPAADPAVATAELVGRYIARFGPVSTDDIRWWTGLPAGVVVAALAALELAEVRLETGQAGWVLATDTEPVREPAPWLALLPSLDPTAMGWKDRRWYLGEHTAFGGPLFDRNGNIGPTVWMDGRVVGAWTQRPGGEVVSRLLVDVPPARRRQLDDECRRLGALIEPARVSPRFPTPLQRELSTTVEVASSSVE